VSLGNKEVSDFCCERLLIQAELIQYSALVEAEGRPAELRALLLASSQTASIISDLGKKEHFNECVILSRALVERCVNYCYLLFCGQDEYDRYWQHSHQKLYRKLSRSASSAGYTVSVGFKNSADLLNNPKLKESLDAFTSKHGREITRWTNVDIYDRITLFSERSGINSLAFMLTMLMVYEDASEALHGTLYGCAFHTGIFQPNNSSKSPTDSLEFARSNLTALTYVLTHMLHHVIEALSKHVDLGEILDNSKRDMSFY
jgi:hypothetical protein